MALKKFFFKWAGDYYMIRNVREIITKCNLWDFAWILIFEPIIKRKKIENMGGIECELVLDDN